MFTLNRTRTAALGSSLMAGLWSVNKASSRLSSCAAPSKSHYDLLVIGGGSGGLATAKRSAEYGKKVCIIEHNAWGGTCVNVGCVPKKIMWNAAHTKEIIDQAGHFGFSVPSVTFDWGNLQRSRATYIKRLNQIYINGLNKLEIDRIENKGYATFTNDAKIVTVGGDEITADHIVIAVGGTPNKLGVPGEEHVIDSDMFFELKTQPEKVAVIGAGYIAVELAGVMNSLGSETSLFVRGEKALRAFDPMLSLHLDESMKTSGVKINPGSLIDSIEKVDDKLTIKLQNGESHSGFDCVIGATGRTPVTDKLNLGSIGIKTLSSGHICVDDYQSTNVQGVYCLGDASDKLVDLTPMAIAAGRRLGDRLFGGEGGKGIQDSKADYSLVPTVVFSHPPIGTIGLTEPQAQKKFGEENIKVYTSSFVNLWYGPFFNGGVGAKPVSKYKLITSLPDEKVVGLHIIGDASDEVLQGFGVAMKMGATKADFDSCIAIHPTAGEELVTMPKWGTAPTKK